MIAEVLKAVDVQPPKNLCRSGGLKHNGRTIFAKAHLDRSGAVRTINLHVQFNEDRTFRDVWLPSPIGRFMGKTSAEKQALQEARQWVDGRLLKAKIDQ